MNQFANMNTPHYALAVTAMLAIAAELAYQTVRYFRNTKTTK